MNSNRTLSRIAGSLYLFVIVGILFGEFYVREKLIVWDDATATAQNILASGCSRLVIWFLDPVLVDFPDFWAGG